MSAVGTLFAQFVSGYAGSNTERRGRGLEAKALWSMLELQNLLDEWIVAAWQNRPHDGLRDPLAPGRTFTPNEKYATLVESTGYLPVALSGDDYIALLPTCRKAINAYGIKHRHRTYDTEQLNPLRRQPSGNTAHNNLWQVHHDPYDVSRIWIRDPSTGGWITVFWTHLNRDGLPFGELAWDHVRAKLPGATEAEIAEAVQALLRRANRGPEATPSTSKRDRRVRARTHSTAQAAWPPPEPEDTQQPETSPTRTSAPNGDDTGDATAEVVPLGVFDPYLKATKRW